MGIIDTAQRLLPSRIACLAAPIRALLHEVLRWRGVDATAQRVPLAAFAICAAVAFLLQAFPAGIPGAFEHGFQGAATAMAACMATETLLLRGAMRRRLGIGLFVFAHRSEGAPRPATEASAR